MSTDVRWRGPHVAPDIAGFAASGLLADSSIVLFQQISDQNTVNGHPLNAAVDDLDIRQVHLAEGAVAQHGFLKRNRSLACLLAVFVRGWADMLERRTAYLNRRNFDVAEIDIMESRFAQVHVVEIGAG